MQTRFYLMVGDEYLHVYGERRPVEDFADEEDADEEDADEDGRIEVVVGFDVGLVPDLSLPEFTTEEAASSYLAAMRKATNITPAERDFVERARVVERAS